MTTSSSAAPTTTPRIRRGRERRRPPGGLCSCRRRRQRSLHRARRGRLALLLHPSPVRPLGRGGNHRRQHHRARVLSRPVRVAHLRRRPAAGCGRGGVGRHARLGAARRAGAAGTGTWRTPASTGTASQRLGIVRSADLHDWERFRDGPVLDAALFPWFDRNAPHAHFYDCRDPFLLQRGDGYLLYYTARADDDVPCIAAASSADLLHWQDRGPGAAHGPLPAGRPAAHAPGVMLRLPPRRPLVPGLPAPRHPLSRLP